MSAVPKDVDDAGRMYYSCPGLDNRGDSAVPFDDPARREGEHETREPSTRAEANLLSSLCADGLHRPVIDLDVPCRLVESTTKGHCHLYVDVPTDFETMLSMLRAMRDAGVVQAGFVSHAEKRGAAFVRPEGVKKGGKKAAAPVETARQVADEIMRWIARGGGIDGTVYSILLDWERSIRGLPAPARPPVDEDMPF